MGVPSFFRYLTQQYKKNDFIIKYENQKPEIKKKLKSINYLLLDANALMHPVCFKVIAENPTITDIEILEDKMHIAIIEAIESLINYVQPIVGVYIAVDGVAPAAKMKQQRYRRFKSISEKQMRNSINIKHNKPISHPWNNSAITPGTKFMSKLHVKFINWIKSNSSKLNYIYSSCYEPGEGEHKLIKFIKQNADKSHIIYGLDADLIFLCLATGLNNLYLLREANELNSADGGYLVYINMDILRIVIPNTIKDFIKKIDIFKNFNYDTLNDSNLINDFIFLCYFLGNDFLPHITAIDINKEGISYLLKAYAQILFNSSIKYIINHNDINQELLIKFIVELASREENVLKDNYKNKKDWRIIESDPYKRALKELENLKLPEIRYELVDPIKIGSDNYESWRIRHYSYYWNAKDEIDEFSQKMVEHYIMGLKWVTQYYFDECKSWSWYYPYDQAPFLNEIMKYDKDINSIKFKLGKAAEPVVQLLSVLPPQSSYLLPKTLRKLMHDNRSSLKYLYPIEFKQDFINKTKYWQGIPLLPPLDIPLVTHIYNKYKNELTEKEKID